MAIRRGALRADGADLKALVIANNRLWELLQQGGLPVFGLKIDTQTAVAPVDGPSAGQPNLRILNSGGTLKLIIWDGAAWQTVGTQT